MNSTSLNYYHINVVIPNMILSNKDFFLNNIIKNPENMEYFITKDTYKKACDRKGITKEQITCEVSANNIGGYFIVYVKFPKDYSDANIAIAIAIKDNNFRYFTYENGNNDTGFVCEWQIDDGKLTKHLNYGQTSEINLSLFAGKLQVILEGRWLYMFIGENPIHIKVEKNDDIAEIVLMPGDPLRAKYIAEKFLSDARLVTSVRNMLGFTGTYKGKKVTVMGSGMGMPSMSIYAFELFHFFNVQKIIRIGTCGAVSPKAGVSEILLSDSVYSESNFAYTYNDYKENVVIANKNLNDTIVATAGELGMQDKLHIGMLTTMDVYGPYIDYDRVLNRIPTEYKDKILGEEMEAYALIHIANSMNRSATAMATVADSKFSNVVMSIEDRQKSLDDMIILALESIIK